MPFEVIANNVDWQRASFLNELTGAQREREAACGIGLSDVVGVGDGIQAAGGVIGILQAASVGLRVQGWLDPSPADYNDDVAMPDDIATDQDLLDLAGLDEAGGFRRATVLPADWTDYNDAAFSYGVIQAGDIIGPWIFVDLQAVYGVLTRQRGGSPDRTSEVHYEGFSRRGAPEWDSWANATADAESDWQAAGVDVTPHAYSSGSEGGGVFTADLWRATTKFTSPNAPVGQNRTMTWYLKPKTPDMGAGSVFDDQGDQREDGDPIVNARLNAMLVEDHDGTGGGATFTSDGAVGSVGASVKPDWPAEPASEVISPGWQHDGLYATIDWDFEYK